MAIRACLWEAKGFWMVLCLLEKSDVVSRKVEGLGEELGESRNGWQILDSFLHVTNGSTELFCEQVQ